MLTLNDGRNELWQWDTGRKLTVDADCSQIHFSNKVFGRSIDVDVVDGVAIIPDVLLQTDKDLTAWAFVGMAENGYTKISRVFKVNRRNKPAGYVFTPIEQTTLAGLIARLDAIEESQDPDAIKNAVEEYLEQNPVEIPVESVNGKTGKVKLTAKDVSAISQDDLQEATNEALAQAKASGEFEGKDGTDGKDGYTPVKGVDYWTEEERNEIIEEVLSQTGDVCIGDTLGIVERSGGYWSVEGNWVEDASLFSKYTELVEVVEGDNFRYTGCGMYAAASVLWYDKDKNLIGYEQYGADMNSETVTVTAPANSAYARFCSFNYGADTVELEVVVQLSERSIPEGFGGGVSSWNDLTDKPFYEESNKETVLENETISMRVRGDVVSGSLPSGTTIEAGETYTVVVDDNEYTLTAVAGTYVNWDCIYLGDLTIATDFNATPEVNVCILYVPEMDANIIAVPGSAESVTVSLYKGSSIIHPIDIKFLPEGGVGYEECVKEPIFKELNIGMTYNSDAGISAIGGPYEYDTVPIVDKIYTVMVNNIEYRLTATAGIVNDINVIYLGDLTIGSELNTNPSVNILVMYAPSYSEHLNVYMVGEYESVSLSIYADSSVVHTINEKFIPNTIARVKDIPHEVDNRVLLVEEDVTLDTNEGVYEDVHPGLCTGNLSASLSSLVVGEKYTVVINGKSYELTAMQATSSTEDKYLGDETIYTSSNMTSELGFVLYYDYSLFNSHFYMLSDEKSITPALSIYTGTIDIHQLDEKFIPDTIARVNDVTTMINEALGAIENGSY